ncbi:MAG: radical SAM/SPASM domain-containing protein [Nitrospirota bacterium]
MAYKSNIARADRTSESDRFPEVILIDNFNGCNLRCSACDHRNISKYRRIQKMDFDLYKKIIDEVAIKNNKARVWEIFFGDPFLCNDMDLRIKYAKDKGLQDVVLNTNGVLMIPEKAKSFILAGLDSIYVGIDAATEETYKKIRVGGDFEKVVLNVLQYRDLLREYGKETQKLFVQFVLSDINGHEVEDFKKFWMHEGVHIKIRPKVSWGGIVDAPNLQPNEKVMRKPCYWLMRSINICADGEVALCSVDVHCRVKCGNVKERTIEEVWKGQLKLYRAMHKEERFGELPELCKQCRDWQSAYADYF